MSRRHSFEGYHKLETRAGQEFTDKLDRFSQEEVTNLDVGDRFVYLSDERMFQNAYEIVKITTEEEKVVGRDEERGEYKYETIDLEPKNHKLVCTRLTKTGKKTSSRNFLSDHFQIDRGSLRFSIRKYYDGVGYDIEEYKEETKRWVRTGSSRDTQRKTVYAAERAVKREGIIDHEFEDINEAQSFVDDLFADEFIQNTYPDLIEGRDEIKVRWNNHLKSKARACYRKNEIQLCTNSNTSFTLSKMIIIHEFAHFCAENDPAGHGPEFTTAYLNLLSYLDEEEASEALREQFDYRDIEYYADELEQEKVAA